MEFHELIARLHELRAAAEREHLFAAAAQLQAWIQHLTMRPQIYARRGSTAIEGTPPPGEG